MDIRITPSPLRGKAVVPPSKSAAHRAAICAALAVGESRLAPVDSTADMLATIEAAKSLGAKAELEGNGLKISGIHNPPERAVIDCGESGSTLRFFVPVAAALGVNASFRGKGRLPQRPMDELVSVLQSHGITIEKHENEILSCKGRLQAGLFEIGGNTSSQYITGLLFALPLLESDSEIRITSKLESRGYVDMTVSALRRFGVDIVETATGYRIKGGQKYKPRHDTIEGDYSSAAFWLCAAAIGGEVEASGLEPNSKQGDRKILELLANIGANVRHGNNTVTVKHSILNGFDVDVSQIPDLVPVLAVTAVFSNGVSRLYNASRLRLKESDRLAAVSAGLKALGAGIIETADSLEIIGQDWLFGDNTVDSFGDHRIAMSMSIAAAYCRNPSVITGAHCVDKSYPGFYSDFTALGGICHVL